MALRVFLQQRKVKSSNHHNIADEFPLDIPASAHHCERTTRECNLSSSQDR